jgi:hypothetical protein
MQPVRADLRHDVQFLSGSSSLPLLLDYYAKQTGGWSPEGSATR